MNEREARFLASQAERLGGGNKRQQSAVDIAAGNNPPELVNDDDGNSGTGSSSKEKSHQFFTNFRKVCSTFQGRIDELLLLPSSTANGEEAMSSNRNNDVSNNDDEVKAYYATATRRNEGRIKLDAILRDVRSLQRHSLSSSSSSSSFGSANDNQNNDCSDSNGNDLHLQSILQTPMPDITQTDMRLISQELDKILKRVDDAREIICPKEKFVFKRYRKAMEELEMKGCGDGGGDCSTSTLTKSSNETKNTDEDEKQEKDNLRSKYGGVLENMSNCTVEIYSDGTILVDKTADDKLQYYSSPRSVDALHPPHTNKEQQGQQEPKKIEQESSSYLLQNLQNVTLLIHGTRPSLHMQHIKSCKIYVSEPTLGAVHVTDCTSSEIHCSCYQLRVHDSTNVKFCVWVRSGPIIEDSKGMVFEGSYYSDSNEREGNALNKSSNGCGSEEAEFKQGPGSNMFWDVKDFNWLRALRKSPNFVVITNKASGESNNDECSAGNEASLLGNNSTATNYSEMEDNAAEEPNVEEEEEDSEDEL